MILSYGRPALEAELMRDEGYRDTPYFCSEGILSIGVGHALGHASVPADVQIRMQREGVMDKPWPRAVLMQLFAIDVDEHEADLIRLAERRKVDLGSLTDRRVRALINMTFNLGARGLGKFVKMWGAMAAGDWDGVARQAMDSRWARQVGVRADRIEVMLREG